MGKKQWWKDLRYEVGNCSRKSQVEYKRTAAAAWESGESARSKVMTHRNLLCSTPLILNDMFFVSRAHLQGPER